MSTFAKNCSPAFLLVLFAACGDGSLGDLTGSSVALREDGSVVGQNIVVEFVGTAQGEFRDIDGIQMDCFDVDIVDPATGRVIGHGSDCLDLGSIGGGDPTIEGFAINNTQFFHLDGGFVKSLVRTTIQPVLDGSSVGNTHITGDVPGGEILEGTGRFSRLEGGVARLSGAVDMSQFFSDNIITFNCIFVLTID